MPPAHHYMRYQGTESMEKAGCANLQNISATGAFTPVSSKIALGLAGLAIALQLVLQYFSVAGRALGTAEYLFVWTVKSCRGCSLSLRTAWFRLNNTSVACASIIPLPGFLIKPHNTNDLWCVCWYPAFLSRLQSCIEESLFLVRTTHPDRTFGEFLLQNHR